MDANQRSEINNQTNNGANEKWTPGAKGKTTDGPLDHTYPKGAAQQQGGENADQNARQSGSGGGEMRSGADLPGGSMQTQISGGTGATQGITDSHQRQMEQRSGAYGKLEQPPAGPGVSLGDAQSLTQGGGQPGTGSMQRAAPGGTRESVDRYGSQTGPRVPDDPDAVHESNDAAGGLPRAPGSSGPWPTRHDTHLTGAENAAEMEQVEGVHDSNDVRGGLPKSPGGANKLAADEKMDDDTGFSNRGR